MAGRNITYLSEANLITCVLQTGLAEGVLEAAKNCGAQGATISYARGTGIRERMGLLGVTIDEQKEVMAKLEKLILPILYNLKKNPEKDYIVWDGAKRSAACEAQIQRILEITRDAE